MRFPKVRVGAAAGVVLAAAVAVAIAGAGTLVPSASMRSAHQHAVSKFGPVSRYAISNWAGYIARGTKAEFTSITGNWLVPKVTCLAKHDLYAPWIGIDGDPSHTVEQTGVQTSCASGLPVHSAWYEMFPAPPVYFHKPISTGDVIAASVTAADGTFILTISDKTQGWSKTVTKTLKSATDESAEAVIEGPGGFPAINAVFFKHIMIDGKALGTYSPAKSGSESAGVIYQPGPITNGTNFTVAPQK